ncbi:HD domain-containing phosphohydrolase [uncultured Sphaerochaeta sp.]|uniref:HD domain-containing phosphohydrolase n=1 Tax=uncultured Sphaerochaeta sp. TaxID=886478 RepID=UPI002A0A5DAE|nr:HD domain-containing phosphohydrolase [uncultured Sphaerochaeta sp.]
MIINVVYNMALLLSLSVFFATYPFKNYGTLQNHKLLIGFCIGLVGILVMTNPYVFDSGLTFDSRSILICVSGMTFGFLPTLLASLMMAIFRIFQGGSGMYVGLAVIAFSAFTGILWHSLRFKHACSQFQSFGWEYLLVGVINHVGMLLCMFFLPEPSRSLVLGKMIVPILVFYPIGTYLLCLLVFNQIHRLNIIRNLEDSELRFKTMFEQAPIGMSLTSFDTGKIIDVNQQYLDILGIRREKLLDLEWKDITYAEDLGISEKLNQEIKEGSNGPFSLEKRFVRSDGQLVWVDLALSVIELGRNKERNVLCMTTDISSRKTQEQRILYASTHDKLTGLHNRAHFEDFIRDLCSTSQLPFSVVFGDVNGLRIVNEAFGREEGNLLLQRIAEIIKTFLREGDYAARVGGDEIALLFPRTSAVQAEQMLLSIQEQVARILVMSSVHPSITFGVCELNSFNADINEGIKKAEHDLGSRKIIETPHIRGRAVYAIINTLHEKNKREELHSRRVSTLCAGLARVLNMDERQINEMKLLGLLHDIGKIAINEAILNKEGKLTPEEWTEIKRHSEIGYRILVSVEDMAGLATSVLSHHERFDGKGYPMALKGYAIPLQARIIAIADSFDAMTGDRTYRKKVSQEEAALELKRNAGTQFDPDLTRVFIEQFLQLDWEGLV